MQLLASACIDSWMKYELTPHERRLVFWTCTELPRERHLREGVSLTARAVSRETLTARAVSKETRTARAASRGKAPNAWPHERPLYTCHATSEVMVFDSNWTTSLDRA